MTGDAIIFIPGIKGTKLVETNRSPFDTLWSGIQSNFETIEHLELTHGHHGVFYDERINTIVQPGEIEQLAYAEFLHDLDTDKPRFIFNYDWRYSAQENGQLLAEFVDLLIAKSIESKGVHEFRRFDFITHSLGNFVFRNYLKRKGFHKVGKAVLTVPPFRGSLDVVSTALIGEGFFPNVKAKIRKLIRAMPGALELLPTYTGASRFVPDAAHNFLSFSHWQGNVTSRANPYSAKMKEALTGAKDVIQNQLQNLKTLTKEERERILIIARDGFDTYQAVQVHKTGADGTKNFVDLEHAAENKHGDGRVPHGSSCIYFDTVMTLMLTDSPWHRDYSHGFVLKDERLQKVVNRFLFRDQALDFSIPGQSIRRVTGLAQRDDPDTGLKYWDAQF